MAQVCVAFLNVFSIVSVMPFRVILFAALFSGSVAPPGGGCGGGGGGGDQPTILRVSCFLYTNSMETLPNTEHAPQMFDSLNWTSPEEYLGFVHVSDQLL